MLITGFPAGPFGTNCFVIAAAAGSECLIIDPGMEAAEPVREVVREHRLRPVAVLLTHGHLDHTWSVVPVADGYGIPAYIHPDDQDRLSDPMATVGPQIRAMIQQFVGDTVDVEPDDVRLLQDGEQLDIAGVSLSITHAPGHTPGSVMFGRAEDGEIPPLLFSGDVLFEGSIGRTDLPGGDHDTMLRSLRDRILPLPDETVVLPGHGGQTSIGRERATNPFLLALRQAKGPALRQGPRKGM